MGDMAAMAEMLGLESARQTTGRTNRWLSSRGLLVKCDYIFDGVCELDVRLGGRGSAVEEPQSLNHQLQRTHRTAKSIIKINLSEMIQNLDCISWI